MRKDRRGEVTTCLVKYIGSINLLRDSSSQILDPFSSEATLYSFIVPMGLCVCLMMMFRSAFASVWFLIHLSGSKAIQTFSSKLTHVSLGSED